ncbi:MAG: beta-N-acetylglucosaminidase domain-containing protein, partial [Verrucomicrobia bacterium]|nr:beta-N-acetylglucosaminidase domain-containing protein [Verrucomicrobiota bacterium]
CRDNGITYCFAVHPQLCSPRPLDPASAEDINQFCQNYDWAQSEGVKWFSVSLDDVSWGQKGPGFGGAQHAKLVNTVFARLRAKDPEAQLIFCPTPYWGDGTPPDDRAYLEALGRDMHPDVYVFWTGNAVVTPRITRKAAASYKSIVKHRLFLWDNYPVNDNAPTLHLGPVIGRDPDLGEVIDGYMSNPLCPQNQINRIPLLTCADYAYNPKAYDPQRSIAQAILQFAETKPQRQALKDLVEAYPGMIRFGGGTGLNPVRVHFTGLLSSESKQSEAQAYLRRMEALASRLDAAFPEQFADAKKTLRDNIASMKQELAKKRGQ